MAQPAAPESNVSSEFLFTLNKVRIFGSEMAYVDTGRSSSAGDSHDITVVLLHGNPTSSYLYRNIIPHISPNHRCVAPDLIGMGHSDKPKIEYRFVDHARYLSAFFDAIILDGKMVLVVQDWGSSLGFDWAYQHPDRIAGLAFMEFIRPFPTWEDFPIPERFRKYRDEKLGRELIIDQNEFVEAAVPSAIIRQLAPEELDYYRRPYLDPPDREPVFRWPNEIPIAGHPADVYALAERYHNWLLKNEIPKLFFWATPGRLVSEEKAKWYLDNLKNMKGVHVGEGAHFLQEDHPHLIGAEIAKWMLSLRL